ncbi:MAG TPA: hypothetical protein VFQ39_18930 [Longimicrobium sp.]|nr:hypothetical protein [Longimicrobium sp.]
MSQTASPRRPWRSIGAVFAGLVVIVILSTATDAVLHATGVFAEPGQPMTAGLWALAAGYRIVISVTGCWLTARLAPDRPAAHALALGIVGVLISAAGTAATWNAGPGFGPRWYPISLIVVALPCAWAGAQLHARRAVAA